MNPRLSYSAVRKVKRQMKVTELLILVKLIYYKFL